MVVFHPPHNSLRRLGQDTVVVAPPVVAPAPVPVLVPASDVLPNYDKPLVTLSPAGIVIGGLVLVVIAFSLSNAIASRR